MLQSVKLDDIGDGRVITLTEDGQSTGIDISLGVDISRKLNPFSKNENCMMCLSSNEEIVRMTNDDPTFDKSSFIYTVFCELPDFS